MCPVYGVKDVTGLYRTRNRLRRLFVMGPQPDRLGTVKRAEGP
jgi:hypothetical protein